MIQMSKLTLRKHFLYKREGVTDIEKISLSSKINKNLQLFNKIVQSNPIMKKSFLKYQYNLNEINKAFNDFKKGKVLRPLIKL